MKEIADLKVTFSAWKEVSAFTPSSMAVVRRLCQRIDFTKVRTIVEYGPGSGVVTRELLRNLNSDGLLIAIELNKELYAHLRSSIKDNRFQLLHGNAKNVLEVIGGFGLTQVDCIVSSIPFFWAPAETRKTIVKNSHQALCPGGQFLALQMCHVRSKYLRTYLETRFSEVHSEIELRNFPPLRVYDARK